MITKVYIERLDGEIASDCCYTAWRGFRIKRMPIEFFQWPELKAGKVSLSPETLVVGGMEEVFHALKTIGVQSPAALNLPECLTRFRGRRIWISTFGELHRKFRAGQGERAFVKPLSAAKAFTGYVTANLDDFEPTIRFPAHMELLCSEPVEIVTEWRYFVHKNEVVGVSHYAGDPLRHPDEATVRAAVTEYQAEAPAAYAIDFGKTADDQTLLVEVNDMFALGCYGLSSLRYANMLEDRWGEVVAKRIG
jgi:hypothetical protein